ncbi:MAG: phosphoribosylanthranilate isomerase [Leptospirillum sp.]
MWVKICGLTDPYEAEKISRMGVDAIGLIFYPPSPRGLTPERAVDVTSKVIPGVLKVGVFVDPQWAFIRSVVERVSLDMIQWHGSSFSEEDGYELNRIGVPWIEVRRVRPSDSFLTLSSDAGASMVLVEGFSEKAPGGTRTVWDFRKLSGVRTSVPLILSGGLDPETVGAAVHEISPFGVDVSSGVEVSPGTKDLEKVARFIEEARK